MKVKIVKAVNNEPIEARIIPPANLTLPSVADGWRFNFRKHAQKKGFQTYILTCIETPDIIEGCLVFELKETVEPYMAYIEIAPHNKGAEKRYDKVAGCLIAYACRLSFVHGKEHFKGWLAFDVLEENKNDEIKLMAVYSLKYGALKFNETTMVIPPETGEKLINEYLN